MNREDLGGAKCHHVSGPKHVSGLVRYVIELAGVINSLVS